MDGPNWIEIFNFLKNRYNQAAMPDRWRMLLRFFAGIPYGWGKENLVESDCSGLVCAVLYIMGYNIRVSADFLYNRVFTKKITSHTARNKIMAVFYIEKETGHCSHIAPVLENYIVLNAEKIIQEKTARSVRLYFEAIGYRDVWRELDWHSLENIALSGNYVYSLDPQLEGLRSIVNRY